MQEQCVPVSPLHSFAFALYTYMIEMSLCVPVSNFVCVCVHSTVLFIYVQAVFHVYVSALGPRFCCYFNVHPDLHFMFFPHACYAHIQIYISCFFHMPVIPTDVHYSQGACDCKYQSDLL